MLLQTNYNSSVACSSISQCTILLLFILNTFSKFILVTNFHTCGILSYDGSCFFKIWKRMHFLFVWSTLYLCFFDKNVIQIYISLKNIRGGNGIQIIFLQRKKFNMWCRQKRSIRRKKRLRLTPLQRNLIESLKF